MKRSRKKKKAGNQWARRIVVLAVIGFFGLLACFVFIDFKVRRRLANSADTSGIVVYSDSFVLDLKSHPNEGEIRAVLAAHRYLESTDDELKSGEFSLNTERLKISTRPFIAADGSDIPGQIVELPLRPPNDNAENARVVLEPTPLTDLNQHERRATTFKPLSEFPKELLRAVIAIEDERFEKHFGLDLYGIARALYRNILAMRIVEGGSTITQQLAKNLLFSPERTLGRKFFEALAALSLELHLTKSEILELYLNEVYLGQEGAVAIHGMPEGARTFFGKELKDLSLNEAAMLAGIIKAPSYFSPRRNYARALERSHLVLSQLRGLELVSQKDESQARKTQPAVVEKPLYQRAAPHFSSALTGKVSDYFNLNAASLQGGVSIYSGINAAMQGCAEQAIREGITQLEQQYPKIKRAQQPLEGALLAIEPYSGKIRAWVGSRDYSANQFDHVWQARRQIGSTIKAFLYLTALDGTLNSYKVASPLTVLSDEPLQVNLVTKQTWEPENFDHKFRGNVTLRYALENSLNIPAAYVGQRVGIASLVSTLKRFRVSEDPPNVPALALGATDTNLLNLTAGYAALANGGIYVAPRLFVSALDSEAQELAHQEIDEQRVAEEAPVYVLTNMLQGVIERGTGNGVRRLGFKRAVAGKTGTSDETRDAWFVGFTPTLAAGVWVGYDDNSKIGLSGGVAAVPIWTRFMQCSEPYYKNFSFVPPEGVVFLEVDSRSGQLARAECPAHEVAREVFVRGSEPTRYCHLHGAGPEDQVPSYRELQAAEKPRKRSRSFWDSLFGR